MRKRLVFETLHLDVEGGVGERRTTPALAPERTREIETRGDAVVKVVMEDRAPERGNDGKIKGKKRVGFKTDRPDIYDF
jgi:elongator complex protein 4